MSCTLAQRIGHAGLIIGLARYFHGGFTYMISYIEPVNEVVLTLDDPLEVALNAIPCTLGGNLVDCQDG